MPDAALFNSAQHGIQGVIGVEKLHSDRNDCQRNEGSKKFAQVDRVFFCGDKAIGFTLRAKFDQVRYVALGIEVMIAIERFGGRFDACSAELHQEIPWTRNSTKNNRPVGNILGKNDAASPPHQFSIQGEGFRSGPAREYHGVGAAQGAKGFAEASGGEQTIASVLGRDQNDIEITGETAMLEAIIQKVQLRAEF